MEWFKLSVDYWDDPKILAIGEGAAIHFQRLIAYSAKHLTDGIIPEKVITQINRSKDCRITRKYTDLLLQSELLIYNNGCYKITNYERWQINREQIQIEREKTRLRVQRHRQCNAVTKGVTNAVSNGARLEKSRDREERYNILSEIPKNGGSKKLSISLKHEEEFKKLQENHPKRPAGDNDYAKAKVVFSSLRKSGITLEIIEQVFKTYAASVEELGTEPQYVKKMYRLLKDTDWTDPELLKPPVVEEHASPFVRRCKELGI